MTIYAIGALDHQAASAQDRAAQLLQQIAEITGGQAFFPTSVKELDSVYDEGRGRDPRAVHARLLSTNEQTDGTWRKVEVKLTAGPPQGSPRPHRARAISRR